MKQLLLILILLITAPVFTCYAQDNYFLDTTDSIMAFKRAMSDPSFLNSVQDSIASKKRPCAKWTAMGIPALTIGLTVASFAFVGVALGAEPILHNIIGAGGTVLAIAGLVSLCYAIDCVIRKKPKSPDPRIYSFPQKGRL